ncbi:Amine oxidase, flavin-containing [Serinicoccus hydrothermalis]|uniref:Amine oxidase, flavin-containing n=1 Tax=Serinicoccus hydrothermalis TaxID=1758689 RepID=A0A1B1NCI8_9MICO|nr:FAD-dependent oxidoreductase [Serinicoccus hydrothermalis]ANS79136.1 Amine oxidase, flavin-containing [Serinicoccus hydrothermalis]
MNHDPRPTAAVIGAGIAGLSAAYHLWRTHRVLLLEADERLGGHADTHDVRTAGGDELSIDSGFIVHNDRTYPVLRKIFAELDVPTQETEMSMSITCDECGLSFAGAKGVSGLLAQPTRVLDRRYRRLLREVPRFHRAAVAELASARRGEAEPITWGGFLERESFDPYFVQHYAIPLISCVWSSGHDDAAAYPAHHLFEFLDHHGLLTIGGSPTWRTVVGGSRVYVQRIRDALAAAGAQVRTGAPVTDVRRHADGVDVTVGGARPGVEAVDQVVLATHADVALRLLGDATDAEREDLGAIRYSTNPTVLHTDDTVLPTARRARASWNYRLTGCGARDDRVLVSYWMNNLHRLPAEAVDGTDYVVTLNHVGRVDPGQVLAEREYTHPIFSHEAIEAAARLREAGGPRLAFAGAHLGWGFHEDGARSGLQAVERLASGRVLDGAA